MLISTPTEGFSAAAPAVFVGDLFARETCDQIRSEFGRDTDWRQAQITTYVEEGAGGSSLKSVLDLDRRLARRVHFVDVDMTMRPHTSACLDLVRREVSALVRAQFGLVTDEFGEAEIVHYPPRGMFAPHADSNKVKPYRAASVVLYLNDDFEGGETTFPDLGYSCTPKAGRVLVFPSQLLHSGQPVAGGEKYIIVLWAFYPGGH